MYYRKYFKGNIEGSPAEYITGIKFGACSTIYNIYLNQSRIVGDAVAETLRDAGMDAYYDKEHFVLYPNRGEGFGLGLFYYGQTAYKVLAFASDAANNIESTAASGAQYQPFSGNAYMFYVTLIGEPEGLLRVHIGAYSAPASMTYGFAVGYGRDVRDGRRIAYSCGAAPNHNSISFWVRHADDCSLVDGETYGSTASFNKGSVAGQANQLVLINAFSDKGYFTLDNCFLGCGALAAGAEKFYMVNGVEYYYPNTNLLIKCPSKILVGGQ